MTAFLIRDKDGRFSKGRVESHWRNGYAVDFGYRGKTWTNEKNLINHLTKCAQHGILDQTWEVVELVYMPTKPMRDWVDDKMLIQMIKGPPQK